MIIDPTAGPDRDTSQNAKTTSNGNQVESLVSQNQVPLSTLDEPGDVSKLVVADPWGNYLLVGEFSPPGKPGPVNNSSIR